jgi:hypothetical protein
LEEAERVCDRVGILVDGRVTAKGPIADLCRLVPADELATVDCEKPEALRARAAALGLECREYLGRPTLLLPERTTVSDLADRLGDVGLRAIVLHPVGLLQVYLQAGGPVESVVTGGSMSLLPTLEPAGGREAAGESQRGS